MLSVLIPTYNYNILPLVKELIAQLDREQYAYEILVLDDASPHRDLTEKNKRADRLKNCSYFIADNNRGRAATRQSLAEKASFKWLLFLDCDVMPRRNDFISRYDVENRKQEEVVYGGVSYPSSQADPERSLHWKYGREREVKEAAVRGKRPFFIFLQNLLIKKNIFFSCNKYLNESIYGLDLQCSYNLKKISARIRHIDNPVVHHRIELNDQYLERMKATARTIGELQRNGYIPPDFTRVQRTYQKLKKTRSVTVFQKSMELQLKSIEKKLTSGDPSLFLLDLYRLYHFSKAAA